MSFLRFGLVAAVAHAQCVTKQLISAGDGVTFPKAGDTVSMHYTGTLASTGAKFDSSRDRGKEFSTQIGVGQVIQGWDQGVPQMSLGEHAILRISAACGYGARGSPPDIPANADLVFDVELNGLNGRRAGATPAASLAAFSPAPPAFPAPIAKAAPASNLPRCIASNCGHAISFDGTGNTRPLCLCNPICQQMAGTPGVLPCCPGLQEVCLDPYRESPTPAPVRAAVTASTNFGSTSAAGSFGLTATSPAAPAALPTCRPNSCGMGMASGVNSMTAVCACDASCLAPNSALPCCQSFREVCQGGSSAASVQQFSQQPAFPQQAAFAPAQQAFAPAQQSFPPAQQAFPPAQQAFPPAQQAFPPAQQAFPPAQQVRAPAQQGFAPAQQAFPSAQSNSASCTWGRTQWAEQASCDTKRWAIQNGKCKKSCSAVDAQVNNAIKFWATGTVGKDACAAALAACGF